MESLRPQQHGNLRGGTSCPPQVQRVLNLVAELTPPAARSQRWNLLRVMAILTGKLPGRPSLHFSRGVKEYSTVLRSLADEGHPALLSLGGPPVREIPNERGVSQSSRGQIVAMTYTAQGNLEVGMVQAQ